MGFKVVDNEIWYDYVHKKLILRMK
jgi:hypothetical protein